MGKWTETAGAVLLRAWVVTWAAVAAPRTRDERGDVPGWVLITVMTATIVGGIWAFLRPELMGMLRSALNSVGG
ncbi:hypothetical protein [uncultured Nocardioides sp.]|uniref:hypothetical protein n=1 Tax=uncultured Nocardioides sp. TaxID=198441 RepID=UPI002611948C|nr:hypothetical protein [uncultured Nocardioides sp.]